MSNPGIRVMLHMLGGNSETATTAQAAIGKVIASAVVVEDSLHLRFTDGSGIEVFDDRQFCCEHRYMRTDDDLSRCVGATLLGLELRDAEPQEDEYGNPHEIQFLVMKTSAGDFTFSNHNEHNGYYGGFAIVVRPLA
jgi:hypothetical protein